MALKTSSELMKYQKQLRKLLDEEIADIMLFGSFVKGGVANDVDVAIICRAKIDVSKTKAAIHDIIRKNADIHLITIDSIYSPLWLTLIKEAYSVKKEAFLHDIYHIKPMSLYKYSLSKLTNVQKVQFERGIKNVIGKEGVFLTRSVVLVPVTIKSNMEDFLKQWDVYYESQVYELIPMMRKEEFV